MNINDKHVEDIMKKTAQNGNNIFKMRNIVEITKFSKHIIVTGNLIETFFINYFEFKVLVILV